ncbi:MAG: flagellar hook-basal body protein [Vulcanimicrobiaceae bacterium]
MNRAMLAAATGMAAQQQNLEVIADNLANADVVGFKSATATFAGVGGSGMLGTTQTGLRRSFEQGKLVESSGPFDLAIDGSGFFAVERDGRRGYTRAGEFARSSDGRLRNSDGWDLTGLRVPASATTARVAPDGAVVVELPGGVRRTIGRIPLVAFDAPDRLRTIGSALFAATAESGSPRTARAGGDREPKIRFGMLERSNVSIIEGMLDILTAQRAYEANAKGVQAADEMQRIANNIQRS